jgi:hypothetical protein
MSSRASLIEVDGQPAGVVAWDGQAYQFHAASKAFLALEGRAFPASGDAELAARRLLRRPGQRPRASAPRPALA